ncbi:MAG: DUF3221 domain-containing protein [Clostridia bacterium]|nr:DUF3221 domain-containing protein [Clostridia bacterium]
MKKSIKILVAVLVLIALNATTVFVICGCNDTENLNPSFTATVLETEPKLLVTPDADTNEAKSSDKIYVSTNLISKNPLPELSVGQKIKIVYSGEIAESYPAQIINVFAIYEAD